MSSGRKSLAKRMENIKYSCSGYYFTQPNLHTDAPRKYFSFGLCYSNISPAIKDYKTPADTRWAIAEPGTKTRKNSLHYVFSEKMFEMASVPRQQDYFVLRADYETAKVNDKYYLESHQDRKAYTTSHTTLLSQRKLIPSQSEEGKTFLKVNLTTTISLLLAPFKNTDEENHDVALRDAFLKKDNRDNTPLFYEYQKAQSEWCNIELYDRLMKLEETDRALFLLTRNEAGKTLLHEVVSDWAPLGLKTQISRFGQGAVKTALCQPDEKGDTPIHYLFSKRRADTALYFVNLICELIKSSKEEPENVVSHRLLRL